MIMAKTFRAIPRSARVAEAIVHRIKEAMVSGRLRRGDRLPSEQELAVELKVSRASVREALKILEALGAVEIRQGSGTFIPETPRPPYIDPLQFLLFLGDGTRTDLVEFRFMLETAFCRIAQLKLTEQDVQKLEISIKELEEAYRRGRVTVEHDLKFHHLILDATRNSFIIQHGKWVLDLFHDSIDIGVHRYTNEAIRHHRLILEALKSKDPIQLELAIRESYRFWQAHVGEVVVGSKRP